VTNSLDTAIAAVVVVALLVYLLYALLNPEKF
jgi:K+-transporting ATPase KdpF subunit